MEKKKCKYCNERNVSKLFSFKRKKDSMRCICNVCMSCYSNILSKANTGKKCSKKTKEKLREINLGKKQSKETIEKRRTKLRLPCSEEKKQKIRLSVSGYKHTKEAKIKMSRKKLGHKQSKITIQKTIDKIKGIKHPPRPEDFSKKMSILMKNAMNNPITKAKNRQHFYNCLSHTKLGKPTDIEQKIIYILDNNNINFVRHHFVKEINHGFAADFYLPEYNIIIEADGDFWHNYPHGNEIDIIRTKELKEKGFIVMRFWGSEIHNDIHSVEKKILNKTGRILEV